MSGGAVAQSTKAEKGKGGRRKKRRISILIDMTPMVDIVMLLLIFYMVTTVFSMPQAMEINLPPEEVTDTKLIVKESKLLQIRVDAENRFFWNTHNPADSLPHLVPSINAADDTTGYMVDSDSLRMLLVNMNRNIDKLNTLVLIHRNARYNAMVDVLDEIDLLERSWNADTAKRLGIDLDELQKPEYKDEKFSYRYAMGDWEDRDDKIVEAALAASGLGGEADGETN